MTTTELKFNQTRTISAIPAVNVAGIPGAVQAACRIVVGFLFACHGVASTFGVLGGHPSPFGSWPGWYASVIEMIGGVLVALGLFTRAAAIICSGTMAYAYFSVHQKAGLLPIVNKGEAAAMFSWTFLLIAAVGPGRFALDAVRRNRTPADRAARLDAVGLHTPDA